MKPPIKIEGAYNLKWRRLAGKIVATWVCPSGPGYKLFRPRTQRIWAGTEVPNDEEADFIRDECQRLGQELKDFRWRPQAKYPSRMYNGRSHIYFIQGAGLIKIGYTMTVQKRFLYLQAGSPVPLKLLGTVPGTPTTEKQLHWRFAKLRSHGEWFKSGPDLLRFIERECQKPEETENDVPQEGSKTVERDWNAQSA